MSMRVNVLLQDTALFQGHCVTLSIRIHMRRHIQYMVHLHNS